MHFGQAGLGSSADCHFVVLWLWTSYLSSLSLSFPIFKVWMSFCLDLVCKYPWMLPGLICSFPTSFGFRLQVGHASRWVSTFLLSSRTFQLNCSCCKSWDIFFVCVMTTKVTVSHLQLIISLFVRETELKNQWCHYSVLLEASCSLDTETRVSTVCHDGCFGWNERAWVKLARIFLEFGNLKCVCVFRRKVLLFLSWSQRSLFKLLDLPG